MKIKLFERIANTAKKPRGAAFLVCIALSIISSIFLGYADGVAAELLWAIVFALSALCAVWLDVARKTVLIGIISSVSVLCLLFMRLSHSSKAAIAVLVFWFWAQMAVNAVVSVIKHSSLFSDAPTMSTLILFFQLSALYSLNQRYTYINGGFLGFPFFSAALLAAVLITATLAVLVYKEVIIYVTEQKFARVVLYVAVFVMSVVAVDATFCNMNYVFDTDEPTEISAVVKQKREVNRSKSADSYYITVSAEGRELELSVTSSEFSCTDKGDTINLFLYDGAFDKHFVIPDIDLPEE